MQSDPKQRSLLRFCLELLALSLLAAAVAVISAYHAFGGFESELARRTALLGLAVPVISVVPIQIYALSRLMNLGRLNRQLYHVATRDGLTQVLNRAAFTRQAQWDIETMVENGVAAYTLLIVDADHFKKINDRLGHPIGDTALTAIAATLRRSVRRDDLVGRLGGEEFAVLLRGAGPEEAELVAERLRTTIERIVVGPADRRTRLSVSIGGIAFRSSISFDAVYRIADNNLYEAKRTGRNRAVLSKLGRRAPMIDGVANRPQIAPPQRKVSWR